MLLSFELSKEHNFLPEAEVFSCFDAFNISYKKVFSFEGVLVLETPESDDFTLQSISKRLAMTRHISKVLGMCSSNEAEILKEAHKIAIKDHDSRFAVRVSMNQAKFDTLKMEKAIGAKLYEKGGIVDLNNPDKLYRVVITPEVCIFGLLLCSVDRGQFSDRKPHLRPFFFPGVVLPKIARIMVNLSRIGHDEILFDPFCGTGGILIEAELVGAKVIGGDVQKRMVLGAKKNLSSYNLSSNLLFGDACNLALKDNSVDAIVIDPPYGRSALIKANSIEDLYEESMREMHRILKLNKRVVMASHAPLSEDIKQGFKVSEEYLLRVHKSLTRHITVLTKV